MRCDDCGRERVIGDFPFCPHGSRGEVSLNAVSDDIPGGMWIENLGPKPVKVYSHTERLDIMRRRKLVEFVRHAGLPGSDKSPHTTNWDVGPSKDGRPLCMLNPEERAARRQEAADRLGVTVEELERISGDLDSLKCERATDDEPLDGGEVAASVIQNRFNLTATKTEMLEIVRMINGQE